MDDHTIQPPSPVVANHHGNHPGFSGIAGVLAALSMVPGRVGTAQLAADAVDLGPGDLLVDIGCGPGSAARLAAGRGAQVTGVDPASVMLTVARLIPGSSRVTWLEGVAEKLPLPDDSATVAWSLATVHHWPDIDGGLAEARRVLRPGGRFLAVERRVEAGATGQASHGWHAGQADRFADHCRRAGFGDVSVLIRDSDRGPQFGVLAIAST